MLNREWNLARKSSNAVLVSLTAIFCLLSTAFAAAATTASPSAVNFVSEVVGTTSVPRIVTLKNTGAASITINSLSVTAASPYSIAGTSTCLNPTLAAGASCTIGVTLSPTSPGAQPAGTLTITTTASNPTTTIPLSGTAIAATVFTANSLSYGNEVVNTTSAAKTVGFVNYFSGMTISSITASAGYTVTGGTCSAGGTMAVGSACNVTVAFAPTATGCSPAP